MKRLFYIFLLIHTLLWSFVPMMRHLLSVDAMEAISWGELVSFGTNKHPPLSGWIIAPVYNIFGHSDFAIYLLGQLFILLGFIYIYKTARFFLDEEKSFCSVMILEGCFYYNWMPFIDNFNPNVLLLGLWPMMIYYFYKSIKENSVKNWIIFGLVAGFSFLGKYQSVFLYIPMFLYMLICEREQFKRKGMYIAILTGLIVILPHVIWLFNNDFFSFEYMLGRTHSETHNLPAMLLKLSHLFYPIKFILGQVMAILGCIALYLILALKNKNISLKNIDGKLSDKIFLICVGILPLILQGTMGFITGSRVPSIWGCVMVCLTGVLLFYFFPINLKSDSYSYFTKWIWATFGVYFIIISTFMALQTKMFISYPYEKIMPEMNKIWAERTDNAPLKYVGGDIAYVFQWRLYNPQHPQIILETFGHSNPWITPEARKKFGGIIITEKQSYLNKKAHELMPYLLDDYEIIPEKYSFDLCNKVGKCKTREFFYVIVEPKI